MREWSEVHRLFERERLNKSAIASRLGMSRPTVIRLLGLNEPPRYEREPAGSKLDPHKDAIAAMLDQDPTVPATVILEHLRRDGYGGGITIVKDHVATIRPAFAAAKSYQRTTYLPGELAHGDWWHTGRRIPVGRGASREAYGWVTTLPHSAAHAAVFSLSKSMADLLPAVVGCFERLGGVPGAMVVDNDPSIVARGVGKNAILHPEVAALCGHLRLKLIVLDPGKPEAKGQVERTNGYLETSFLPLREFIDVDDLQSQHDGWAIGVAWRRHHRRVGGRVAEALPRSGATCAPCRIRRPTRRPAHRGARAEGRVRPGWRRLVHGLEEGGLPLDGVSAAVRNGDPVLRVLGPSQLGLVRRVRRQVLSGPQR